MQKPKRAARKSRLWSQPRWDPNALVKSGVLVIIYKSLLTSSAANKR